jgi:hypothetical protein
MYSKDDDGCRTTAAGFGKRWRESKALSRVRPAAIYPGRREELGRFALAENATRPLSALQRLWDHYVKARHIHDELDAFV